MNVLDTPVSFQLGCGATCNVLPAHVYSKVAEDKKFEKLKSAKSELILFDPDTQVKSLGSCQLTVVNPKTGKQYTVEFHVEQEFP